MRFYVTGRTEAAGQPRVPVHAPVHTEPLVGPIAVTLRKRTG